MAATSTPPAKLLESRWGKWIAVIWGLVVVIGLVVAAAIEFIADQTLISPIRGPLLVVDVLLITIASVITAVAKFGWKSDSAHGLQLILMGVGIVLAIGLFTFIVATEGAPDLVVGDAVTGELEESESALHRFRAEPGDAIVLRIRLFSGLKVVATATNGELTVPVSGPPEGGPLELSKVVAGGVWTLQLDSVADTKGRYRVDYEIVDTARELGVDSDYPRERVNSTNAENGYVAVAADSSDVTIDVQTSPADLPLTIILLRETRTEFSTNSTGDFTVPIRLRAGSTYVLIIRGEGTSGSYRITSRVAPSFVEPTTPSTLSPDVRISLPPLYNLTESDAYEQLSGAGLLGESIRVCSGSVAEGRVRQAFIVDPDGTELTVDDEPDASIDARSAAADQAVYMKVSTGEPCS